MFFILLHLFIFGILFGLTSIRCWKLIEILKIQWTMPLISIHFTDLVVSYEPYLNVIAACWLYWITRRSLFTVLDLLYVLFFFFSREAVWMVFFMKQSSISTCLFFSPTVFCVSLLFSPTPHLQKKQTRLWNLSWGPKAQYDPLEWCDPIKIVAKK